MKLSANCFNYAEQLLENPAADAANWDLTEREVRLATTAADSARSIPGLSVAEMLSRMETYLSAMEAAPRDSQGRQIVNLECETGGISHPR